MYNNSYLFLLCYIPGGRVFNFDAMLQNQITNCTVKAKL